MNEAKQLYNTSEVFEKGAALVSVISQYLMLQRFSLALLISIHRVGAMLC